ncbi:MAG: START domain-containing protein [Myxococcota bacterium]
MKRMLLIRRRLWAMAVLTVALLSPEVQATPWEQTYDEQGIRVWRRKIEGSSIIEFRGETVVKAHIKDVLAVIIDHDHRDEWMERLKYHKVIRLYSDTHALIYGQLDSGFPLVQDRDVVVDASITLKPDKRQVVAEFLSVEDENIPPRDGFIRMPKLTGKWILTADNPMKTQVIYEAYGDPGGWIPAWVTNIISRKLPLWTLVNLRKLIGQPMFAKTAARMAKLTDWRIYTLGEKSTADHATEKTVSPTQELPIPMSP